MTAATRRAAMSALPPHLRGQLAAAIADRDAGMAAAEAADLTGWNTALVDQAIEHFADAGITFSANDFRELFDVPGSLVGARFMAASVRRRIRSVGWVRSTLRNTHGKPIALWVGRNTSDQVAS